MAVQGQWNIGGFNLPDFGISEALGIGAKNPAIVASNPVYQNASSPISPTSPTGNIVNSLSAPKANVGATAGGTQYGPSSILGTSTGGGGQPQQSQSNPFNQASSAAQSQNDALLSSLNTQFDRNAANAQNQLGMLGSQFNDSVSQLDNVYGQAQSQTANAKAGEQTNADNQINQAGATAHQTQQQTRNILRALGIEGGTYAGEALAKPLNAYDQQRGQINTVLTQRNNQLDDFLNQQASQHAQAVSSVRSNYNQLVNQIQTDLRFNDRQRADAIQQANAALQDHLAQIQQSLFDYKTKVDTAKAGLGQLATTLGAYNNNGQNTNTANLPAIQNTAPQYAQPQSQTAAIFQNAQDPNKKNIDGGLGSL